MDIKLLKGNRIISIIHSGYSSEISAFSTDSERALLTSLNLYPNTIKLSLKCTFSIIIYIASLLFTDGIISVFNSEKSVELYNIAKEGIRIFFAGFIFASINIVLSSFYSAVDSPKKAFIISVLRGFLLIIPLAYIMAKILGMTGIWLSFVLTELIVTIISIIIGKKKPAKKSLLQN